jgi:CheY-like chemotaxis protein
MDRELVSELIRASPGILTVLLAAIVILKLYGPFRDHILPNLTSVRAFGVQLDLRPEDIRRAGASKGVDVSISEDSALYARAVRAQPVLRDAEVLWVDDHPAVNVVERRLLHKIGVFVEPIRSTEEALEALAVGPGSGRFELVISDMRRNGDPGAGEQLIRAMRAAGYDQPVILYLGQLELEVARGTPVGAFGITNRPDELLHLVIDALERREPTGRVTLPTDRPDVELSMPGD